MSSKAGMPRTGCVRLPTVIHPANIPGSCRIQNRPPSWKISLLCAIFLAIGSILSPAAEGPSLPEWKKRRSALTHRHQVQEFRIHYSLEGRDGLQDLKDQNQNGIPDRIEDIATQLITARDLYQDVLGLRHPLQSPRYRERARFIDINVGRLPFTTGAPKLNGSAGDAIVNYYRPMDPPEGVEVLTIDILNTLSSSNLTPTHELFHLYQYGYTLYKGGWYLEGTARWSELAFKEGAGKPESLPRSREDLEKLWTKRYDAIGFWAALAHTADPESRIIIPPQLLERRLLGNGEPVIRDSLFPGATLLKDFLEAMDRRDDETSREKGLNPLDWPETFQKSPENNPMIWKAVLDATRLHASKRPALQEWLKSMDSLQVP